MPLLANPALSAALLQMLLQNQAKAQQVLLHSSPSLWHASSCCSLIQLLILPLTLAFFPPWFLSLCAISKPFWGVIFCGLRCCTLKKTLECCACEWWGCSVFGYQACEVRGEARWIPSPFMLVLEYRFTWVSERSLEKWAVFMTPCVGCSLSGVEWCSRCASRFYARAVNPCSVRT